MKKKSTTMIYEEERLLLHCQEAIADAIERRGMQRRAIAAQIGKNKSFVTQALSSGRNLTLTSLASLLWAAGFRLEPTLVPIAKEDGLEEGGKMHRLELVARGESYEATSTPMDISEVLEDGAAPMFGAAG